MVLIAIAGLVKEDLPAISVLRLFRVLKIRYFARGERLYAPSAVVNNIRNSRDGSL